MLKLCESFGVKMHLLQIIKSISIILHEEFRNAQIESSKLPDILDVNDLQCAYIAIFKKLFCNENSLQN